jgi:hypothetical protein
MGMVSIDEQPVPQGLASTPDGFSNEELLMTIVEAYPGTTDAAKHAKIGIILRKFKSFKWTPLLCDPARQQ